MDTNGNSTTTNYTHTNMDHNNHTNMDNTGHKDYTYNTYQNQHTYAHNVI